jgi:hypothetical protein
MSRTVLVATSALLAGMAMAHVWYQATVYHELHIADCATAEPLVLAPALAAARLDAFVWGHGTGPVEIDVHMGDAPVEKTVIVPGDDGELQWSYHGDWYDDLVINIAGEDCKLNITYRL